MVDIASIIVGLAVFAQWCGILRFLSYFDKYNMLLLTLRLSIPSVVRFFVCAGILYFAFLFCGWLVLGAYHPKVSGCISCNITMYYVYIYIMDIFNYVGDNPDSVYMDASSPHWWELSL